MHNKRRRLFVLIIPFLVVILILLAGTALSGQNDDASFDPATYGIPEQIAGYEVIAIQTSDNTLCRGRDTITVIVRSPEANMGRFITSGGSRDIEAALNAINPETRWEVQEIGIGPGVTRETIIRDTKRRNTSLSSGCVTLGGPIRSLTPTPETTDLD